MHEATCLAIGYDRSEYEVVKLEWENFQVEIDLAAGFRQATKKLSGREYLCVAVHSEYIPHKNLIPAESSGCYHLRNTF